MQISINQAARLPSHRAYNSEHMGRNLFLSINSLLSATLRVQPYSWLLKKTRIEHKPVITNTSCCSSLFFQPLRSVISMLVDPCNLRTRKAECFEIKVPCCSTSGTLGTKKKIFFSALPSWVATHFKSSVLMNVLPLPVSLKSSWVHRMQQKVGENGPSSYNVCLLCMSEQFLLVFPGQEFGYVGHASRGKRSLWAVIMMVLYRSCRNSGAKI